MDMSKTANYLRDMGGGIVIVEGGKVLGELPLEYAGLMLTRDVKYVSGTLRELHRKIAELGCELTPPS